MNTHEPIVGALEAAGYRRTAPRRALAVLIGKQAGHFTAADLVTAARARGLRVGRATLFRTLELLTGLGSLERIDLPNGEHAYVRCAAEHHHHLVCSSCGRSLDVADRGLAEAVADIARRTGFRVDSHRIELFGECRECRRAAGRAPA
jgi:Fur family ferric uptake transcriptional regulator